MEPSRSYANARSSYQRLQGPAAAVVEDQPSRSYIKREPGQGRGPKQTLLDSSPLDPVASTNVTTISSAKRPSGTARFPYEGRSADEISFDKGEKLRQVDQHRRDWWIGTNAAGKRGFFPSSLVDLNLKPVASRGCPPWEWATPLVTPHPHVTLVAEPESLTNVIHLFTLGGGQVYLGGTFYEPGREGDTQEVEATSLLCIRPPHEMTGRTYNVRVYMKETVPPPRPRKSVAKSVSKWLKRVKQNAQYWIRGQPSPPPAPTRTKGAITIGKTRPQGRDSKVFNSHEVAKAIDGRAQPKVSAGPFAAMLGWLGMTRKTKGVTGDQVSMAVTKLPAYVDIEVATRPAASLSGLYYVIITGLVNEWPCADGKHARHDNFPFRFEGALLDNISGQSASLLSGERAVSSGWIVGDICPEVSRKALKAKWFGLAYAKMEMMDKFIGPYGGRPFEAPSDGSNGDNDGDDGGDEENEQE